MLNKLIKKIFGNRNERVLRQFSEVVIKINLLEPHFKSLSDQQLQAKTEEFKQRLCSGANLDDLLPETFAAVREAAARTLEMRHFDVQLIGGMVLHSGKIAEMRTGEGKTLVATLPAYLNALTGKGVHIVTVNDYLAKRDAEWMQPVYHALGLTTGFIVPGMSQVEKQAAYRADIVYGTNNEFGFDYLRDNMAFNLGDRVQQQLNFAIVDEVDSILIDEARTPLIISGSTEESSSFYRRISQLIPNLVLQEGEQQEGDFTIDEKLRQAYLTEAGHQKIEHMFTEAGLLRVGESLYDTANATLLHYLHAALRAHYLFHRDIDYIVKDDQVIIVDEHTGRTMPGRRWSEGLHQALEAKENVHIQNENQTLASITFQNYFRLYNKLAGMTGTADTEAYEFQQIYGLEVLVIPTHQPSQRQDKPDLVFLTVEEKFQAVIEDIKSCRKNNQPVLVGTISIENSEFLSKLLHHEHIPHQVLNAKYHAQEANIIAEAGRPGNVTIATNMAGRGTDIVLGGNLVAELKSLPNDISKEEIENIKINWRQRHEQVVAAGGLYVIGSERHESRRIDNQLRGRCGRQGDPGCTRFYLSLQDNLMRIFAADRMSSLMQKLGLQSGEAIQHPWVTKAIENAQRKVEGRNFDIRKELLEFDNVANDQRHVIYEQRYEIMAAEDISQLIQTIRHDVVAAIIDQFISPNSLEEQWNIEGLMQQFIDDLGIVLPIKQWLTDDPQLDENHLRQRLLDETAVAYADKEQRLGTATLRQMEKSIMLHTVDTHWREHLALMDHLRQGIHLRGYAQKNPKQEYKRESFALFSRMLESLKHTVISTLYRLELQPSAEKTNFMPVNNIQFLQPQYSQATNQQTMNVGLEKDVSTTIEPVEIQDFPPQANTIQEPKVVRFPQGNISKVGRNQNCPCGSGKKFKYCHGQVS